MSDSFKYCVSRKHWGPICYEISKTDRSNISFLVQITMWSIVILIVVWLLFFQKQAEHTNRTSSSFWFLMMIPLVMFIVYVLYVNRVTSRSKVLCDGYRECRQ